MLLPIAIIYERSRLGERPKFNTLSKQEALEAYTLLFPNETLTERRLLVTISKQLQVPYEILREMAEDDAPSLLASESSASNPSGWSLTNTLSVRDAVISGDFDFLSLTKQMNEIEAKLFWSSIMGKRPPFYSTQFLKTLNLDISPDIVSVSKQFLSDVEIIHAIYEDDTRLIDPKRWSEKPTIALRKRRWLQWGKHTAPDTNMYQALPNRGRVDVVYNEEENIIIERAGNVVTDVAYPEHPSLSLKERLTKYAKTHDVEIAWPEQIPSWEAIMKKKEAIRFPNEGAFTLSDHAGYTLVKQSHIHNLRLRSYRITDALEIQVEAVDGIDDYIMVGVCRVHIPSERASLAFDIERILGSKTSENKTWQEIPEEKCIVVRVASPFLDRRTGVLSNPTFIEVNTDMGISDITQYVDLVGADAD
tara:strand:- start:6831 stop:8090 length:1260 start_codon:yes stop_codon:yes gene_type:complete